MEFYIFVKKTILFHGNETKKAVFKIPFIWLLFVNFLLQRWVIWPMYSTYDCIKCLICFILDLPLSNFFAPISLFLFFFYRCFFFGDVSSKRDPVTYLTYIHALYDHYRKESSSNAGLPLVINTPGWVKGVLCYCFYLCVYRIITCIYLVMLLLSPSFYLTHELLLIHCRCWLWHSSGHAEVYVSFPCSENLHFSWKEEPTSWGFLVRRGGILCSYHNWDEFCSSGLLQ